MKRLIVLLVVSSVVCGLSPKRQRRPGYAAKNKETEASESHSENNQDNENDGLNSRFSYAEQLAGKPAQFKFGSDKKTSGTQFSEFNIGSSKLSDHRLDGYDEEDSKDDESYAINSFKSTSPRPTIKSTYDFSNFKLSTTAAPFRSKFNYQHSAASDKIPSLNKQNTVGLFKLGGDTPAITTKFAISHPTPTHTASNLAGSYQTFDEDSYSKIGGYSPSDPDKFLSDYQSTLSKLSEPSFHSVVNSKPKFQQSASTYKYTSEFNLPQFEKQKHFTPHKVSSPDPLEFKPYFKLQDVPNLYPTDDHFKPSIGLDSHHQSQKHNIFEPLDNQNQFSKDEPLKFQLLNNQNPATKGQYAQFLKAQSDEKLEQKVIQQQQKYPSRPNFGSSKFRPSGQQNNFNSRRKPGRPVTLGLGHYRTPIIDGPYTIHFSE